MSLGRGNLEATSGGEEEEVKGTDASTTEREGSSWLTTIFGSRMIQDGASKGTSLSVTEGDREAVGSS
jgi:hypothetical protein